MKYTWQAEADLHFGLHAAVIEGNRPQKIKRLPADIVVINYDILSSWLPVLLDAGIRILILDEIHYVKNPTAKRTKACMLLSENVDSIVGLSGTPILNWPVELWAPLQMIKPELFPSFSKFAWRYTKPKHTPWGWTFTGARKTKELNRILLENVMIRRLKKDVLPELPDKIQKVISFRLSSKSYKEYTEAEKHFLRWLRKISPAKAHKAKKSQALTKIGYLLRLVAQLKMEQTIQWLKDFAEAHPDEKLIGLTMNTFVIDRLKKEFPDCVIVDGRVTGRDRTESVRKFQTNKKVKWFWGNWKAAGVGITLTAAHHLVSLDFPWTPGDLEQGIARPHRIGQEKDVMIYFLSTLNTIEEKLMKTLHKKSSVIAAVIDGRRDSMEFDLFDELLKELRKG